MGRKGDDTEWIDTIHGGSQWQRGLQLIDLFVSILLFYDVADIGGLSVALSGIASLLLPSGRTSYSRFRISIDLDKDSCCAVDVTSDLVELIKDHVRGGHNKVFGGKVVVLGGDFRQIHPVISNGTRFDIVTSVVNKSDVTLDEMISTGSTLDNTANLSDAIIYAFLANQPDGSQLVHEDQNKIPEEDLEEMDLKKITINGSDTAGYDKSKVEYFNCHKMRHIARECRGPRNQESRARNQDSSRRTVNVEETASKAMVAIDGAGFNWSYMADEEVLTNLALMDFSDSEEFQEPEFEGYGFKDNKSVCKNSANEIKKTTDALIIEYWVSDCDEDDTEVMVLKSDNVQHKPEQANQPKKRTGQREVRPVWNNAMRVNHHNFSNSRRNFVPTVVLTKSGIVPVSAARPINTVAPKSFVNSVNTAKGKQIDKSSWERTGRLKFKLKVRLINNLKCNLGENVVKVLAVNGYNEIRMNVLLMLLTLMGYVSNDDKLTFQKARMVISDDEDDLVSEDTSKQGRMTKTEYEEVEIDTLQQLTPTKVTQAKILPEASRERVKTYTRRRSLDSSRDSTTGGLFSTTEEV
ncbi:ribonuclease H-like domain-containing protein [Tanacetum coccineum]